MATGAGTDLWTPDGVEYVQSWHVGKTGEDGWDVYKHEFRLTYRGETEMFGVLAEESASEAQIEDTAAWTAERSMRKIVERLQQRGSKLVPEMLADRQNWDVRRDVAAMFRDFRSYMNKRRESTSGRIYYPGAN